MGLGRRKIRLEDEGAWVFNRMADVYDARPPYPSPLIDALAELSQGTGRRIADVAAGTGHLALPLAARGFDVTAIEPARAMLDRLEQTAQASNLPLHCVHAVAEALPLATESVDLVIVADALHFLDAERTACEIRRVLVPQGALAIITCELADTPFMRALVDIMHASAPRRPRELSHTLAQVSAVARTQLTYTQTFDDETPVDPATLERILRSISFIGPAMNPDRFSDFCARVHALPEAPVWARRFTLRSGRKRT